MNTPTLNLLSLPIGIRLDIYRYLLIQPLPVRPKSFYDTWHERDLPELSHNILHTCRQIHDEALPLLYRENVFYDYVWEYGPRGRCEAYHKDIGFPCHNLALIKHVNIKNEWQMRELDEPAASCIQFYVRNSPSLITFTMRFAGLSHHNWLSMECELSNTAKALAALGEGVELNILAWNWFVGTLEYTRADDLKELRLAIAPEELWATGKNYKQGHYHRTGRFWRCRPGKRLL